MHAKGQTGRLDYLSLDWLRCLKDAKDSKTYRVVYGDLGVKDVPARDLPLPVDP